MVLEGKSGKRITFEMYIKKNLIKKGKKYIFSFYKFESVHITAIYILERGEHVKCTRT